MPGSTTRPSAPLIILAALQLPVMAALAVPLARDYMHNPPGSPRYNSFLVAAGFLLNGIFDGTRAVFGLFHLPGAEYPWLPWGWAFALLPPLSLIPAVAAFIMILVHRFRQREMERALERRLLIAVALAALTALAAPLLSLVLPVAADGGFFSSPVTLVAVGFWRLALPLLVSYALFRYAFLDVDEKVRKALQSGILLGAFGIACFLVSETVEGLVSDAQGQIFGLLVAAVLTFVVAPVRRLSAWMSRRAMPGAKPVKDVHGSDALELYRSHYALVSQDGQVTARERHLLEGLAKASGLTTSQVRRLEREVDSRPGARRGRTAQNTAGSRYSP